MLRDGSHVKAELRRRKRVCDMYIRGTVDCLRHPGGHSRVADGYVLHDSDLVVACDVVAEQVAFEVTLDGAIAGELEMASAGDGWRLARCHHQRSEV
jgi:hypothetical protein